MKNNVPKKHVYNAKIKDIEHNIPDITNLTANTALNIKINKVKNEIPSFTNLVTNASLNAKRDEVKNKICSIADLATATAITAVKNKIPEHNSKYITTPEYNKFTTENFTAMLKQASVATKGDIADFVKKTDFDDNLKNLDIKLPQRNQNIY